MTAMNADLSAARSFMTAHARTLDRRRFEVLVDGGDGAAVLEAVDAYRNADGGYGWGLEPDLRAPESQPGGAFHAFEAIADAAPAATPRAVQLCDWLETASLPDCGLPFALPVADPTGCAPFWANADPAASSLQITAYVTARALRVAAHHAAVAEHPWLARATDYCLASIEAVEQPFAIELLASVQFLDAVHDRRPEAASLLERLRRFIPDDGYVRVTGGSEDEKLGPLEFAPLPDRPARTLFSDDMIATELRRLAEDQQPDGGWRVDFENYSPAAELEWRGYRTVWATWVLRRNGLV